jgi:WD40 repeat protein
MDPPPSPPTRQNASQHAYSGDRSVLSSTVIPASRGGGGSGGISGGGGSGGGGAADTHDALEDMSLSEAGVPVPGGPDGAFSSSSSIGIDGTRPWKSRVTLRSHFDGVRSVAFHSADPQLLTASEDGTLKLWSVDAVMPASPGGHARRPAFQADVEPALTLRYHDGPVLACAFDCAAPIVYSGGLDGRVVAWSLPETHGEADPYARFGDDNHVLTALSGHTDAVWGVAAHPFAHVIASASADGTVRVWRTARDGLEAAGRSVDLRDAGARSEAVEGVMGGCLGTLGGAAAVGACFAPEDPSKLVAAFADGSARIYDVETLKEIAVVEAEGRGAATCITVGADGIAVVGHVDKVGVAAKRVVLFCFCVLFLFFFFCFFCFFFGFFFFCFFPTLLFTHQQQQQQQQLNQKQQTTIRVPGHAVDLGV